MFPLSRKRSFLSPSLAALFAHIIFVSNVGATTEVHPMLNKGNAMPPSQQQDFIAHIIATKVICKEPTRYLGWPSITTNQSGELKVVFSGDRDQHICPFGKVQMVCSKDCGKSWSDPTTIENTPLDDRDAGIIETQKQTEVLSWFTSTMFADKIGQARKYYGKHLGQQQANEMIDRWIPYATAVTPEVRKQWLGSFIAIKPKESAQWQDPVKVSATAPHGPIELRSGRLLYVGNQIDDQSNMLCLCSDDEGRSWRTLSLFEKVDEQDVHLCEPHCVVTASGKLLALFRVNSKDQHKQHLYRSESIDGGITWSKPTTTNVWGFPPHLLRLPNGWLLASYGKRIKPYGEYACISKDEGNSWLVGQEICLASAHNDDLGYPCSTLLPDGSIATVFYQIDHPQETATCIMMTHWKLEMVESSP